MERELETYWSHYKCEDPSCPGKARTVRRQWDRSTWITFINEDGSTGRKREKFSVDAE